MDASACIGTIVATSDLDCLRGGSRSVESSYIFFTVRASENQLMTRKLTSSSTIYLGRFLDVLVVVEVADSFDVTTARGLSSSEPSKS